MSLQFSGHGTREGVLKKLSEFCPAPPADAKDDKLPHGSDRAQVEAVRSLVASEIQAIDPKSNGVQVMAEANAHAGARTVTVTIFPREVSV